MRANSAMWTVLFGVFLGITPVATGAFPASDYVTIEKDFVADFDAGMVSNSVSFFASREERSGRQPLPGIFLHTQGEGDAVAAYPGVAIPPVDPRREAFLIFRIGFRDDIPWDKANAANGVRFMVAVDGKTVFSEDHAGVGWQPRAVGMAAWAGKSVRIELRTNAIDQHTGYDWALFGQPLLVTLPKVAAQPIPKETIGLSLAEVTCSEPSDVVVQVGVRKDAATHLPAGTHWIPVHYVFYSEPVLHVESGAALLTRVLSAPFTSQLAEPSVDLGSPLVTAGRPFNVRYETKNIGLGVHAARDTIALVSIDGGDLADPGSAAMESFRLEQLAPGDAATVVWQGLVAPEAGERVLNAGGVDLPFHVFGPEPTPAAECVEASVVSVTPDQPIAASVSCPGARLSFVCEPDGRAYAMADVWNGSQWQRVASLYPLARVEVERERAFAGTGPWFADAAKTMALQSAVQERLLQLDFLQRVLVMTSPPSSGQAPQLIINLGLATAPSQEQIARVLDAVTAVDARFGPQNVSLLSVDGDLLHTARGGRPEPAEESLVSVRVPLDLRVASFEAQDDALLVHLASVDEEGWRVALAFTPSRGGSRIKMAAQLTAPSDAELLAFYGPSVLAGDRAYGVEKDFALFGGLEYLEGDEHSSSERDLAYPLCDRRVPAIHKIAAPVMAVQGGDALVALLWDANQSWAENERHPAARFLAPAYESGFDHIHMSLFAPSVGEYVKENTYYATNKPYAVRAGETLRLESTLALDHKAAYGAGSVVNGPHKGGLVLQAMRHWYDEFGFPEPSPQPRDWDTERALCRDGYMNAVWSEDPPAWSHCAGWAAGLHVGHAVPLMLDLQTGVPEPQVTELRGRIDRVLKRALDEQGRHYFWSGSGCHILSGELPFYHGYLGESLGDMRRHALGIIAGRERGLWIWRPNSEKAASLGNSGDHTLGQAAGASHACLRAARLTGDPELAAQALDAMKQMERYEVPRGAQMWECPLYQPDILAAAAAIRAYCEAYRLTGDPAHLDHARYWAWTGLPFLYSWEMEGYPTMRYNVISVIGSTFYSHSWLGLPVVWCGLVYAYALQDLAQYDSSLDWRAIAQGINNSAMWQQYADGPTKGTYPDSWNMIENRPNPADINPENILVNEFRLRGRSPAIRFIRLERGGEPVALNSAADIVGARVADDGAGIQFHLKGAAPFTAYTLVAPVPEPTAVIGAGARAGDSDDLQAAPKGWIYDEDLRGVILKSAVSTAPETYEVTW